MTSFQLAAFTCCSEPVASLKHKWPQTLSASTEAVGPSNDVLPPIAKIRPDGPTATARFALAVASKTLGLPGSGDTLKAKSDIAILLPRLAET